MYKVYCIKRCVYLGHDVSVSMTCGEMQRRIVATVHHIYTGTTHDEHVDDAVLPFPTRPVERAEAVVITKPQGKHSTGSKEDILLL